MKRRTHWISQTLGAFFIIGGIAAKYIQRENLSLDHITSSHSIFGYISLIFLVNSILLGIFALYACEISKLFGIKVFVPKFLHNITGITTFITGEYFFESIFFYYPRYFC